MTAMDWITDLSSLDGVSGREAAVRGYICDQLSKSPAKLTIREDALGNLIVHVEGRQRAAKRLLYAAHMDEVGFMILGATDEGYLRFTTVGGVDASVLFGRRVIVNGHVGVIGGKAIHQCTAEEKKTAPAAGKLLIDIGCDTKEEALTVAKPGDTAVFESGYTALESGRFKARALDDRIGCALLLELASEVPAYDIFLAFTVQEEVGLRGAKTAAYGIEPDIAVVIDATTAADTVGVGEDKQVCKMGAGPVISFMDNHTLYDKPLFDLVFAVAAKNGISAQTKTMVAGGNDAGAIHGSRAGVRTTAISLPCRYLHSPSCVLAQTDVANTAKLLKALISVLAAEEFI